MLGFILSNHRKKVGLSKKEMAQKIGIDPSLLSRFESENRLPTAPQIDLLASVLGIDKITLLKPWIADQVIGLVKPYPIIANEVLQLAETRIEYLVEAKPKALPKISKKVQKLLDEVDSLKLKWQSLKPLNQLQLEKIEAYFKLQYTFESNKIEGNTLSLQETHLVLNEGLTIGGKSMREHLEAINHDDAIDLINDFVTENLLLNQHRLLQIHQLILKGIDRKNAGVYRSVQVRIMGSKHIPPEPFLVQQLMDDYFTFYEEHKNLLHPVILAAEMHERLVSIHPFIDGNGRTSRLVMNLILLQNGFTIANLKGNSSSRLSYYKSLENVQVNNNPEPFYVLILSAIKASLTEHIALA